MRVTHTEHPERAARLRELIRTTKRFWNKRRKPVQRVSQGERLLARIDRINAMAGNWGWSE